jgi:DNA-binding GntR family transcriptional regulator
MHGCCQQPATATLRNRILYRDSSTNVREGLGVTSAESGGGATVTRVYHALRTPILDGAIPPGERISIDAVARNLGVSQTPVREALQRLEGDGLLVYQPHRGYRTTPMLDLTGQRSVFEFRLLVEPWAVRAAAADRLSNPAAQLEEEIDGFADVAKGDDVRQELLGHDTRFHGLILKATGNEVVQAAYAQTHCHLHVFRLSSVDPDGMHTIEEHRRIVQAIHDCDSAAAEAAMSEHLRSSYDRSAQVFGAAHHTPRVDAKPSARALHRHGDTLDRSAGEL